MQYQGHAPNASPLQKHSLGDTWPYIIGYTEPACQWYVQAPSGQRLSQHATHQAAEAAIVRAKQLDALIGKRVVHPRAGTVQSISHGVNATVAVRFDTDSYDTHLPPSDLKATA